MKKTIAIFLVITFAVLLFTGCNVSKMKFSETYHFEEVKSFTSSYNLYYKNNPPPKITNILTDPLNPKRIYVATAVGGLFKSEDSGANWVKADLPEKHYHSYIININQKGELYIVNFNNILYTSSDAGKNWEAKTKIPLSGEIKSIKFGMADIVYISNGYEILKSEDGGKHFNMLKLPDVFYGVNRICFNVNPYSRNEIYVSSGTILYKSSDEGKTWKEVSSISKFSDYGEICHLVFDGKDAIIVLAENFFPKDQTAILKSKDRGKTWKVINKNLGIRGTIYKNPYKKDAFFIAGDGLYALKDNGSTYQYLGVYSPTCINFDKLNPGRVFVGTSYGKLLMSKKGVENVKIIDKDAMPVTSIAVSKKYVYVAKNGIYRSKNLEHWEKLSSSGYFILVSQDDKLIIRGDNYGSSGIFIYRSTPKKWEKLSDEKVYSMAKDPTFSNVYIGTDNGIYRYSPSKNTLNHIAFNKPIVILFVDSTNPNIIYAALNDFRSGHAIYRSTDKGKTWQFCDKNILNVEEKGLNANNALIDLEQPQSIFARGNNIYVSILPSFPGQQNMYLGYSLLKGGLFVSKDFGKTWGYVKSLLLDKKYPCIDINNVWECNGKVFVSIEKYQFASDIAYSSDLENWQYLKVDPASPDICSVYYDKPICTLYVGTTGGIYLIKIQGDSYDN